MRIATLNIANYDDHPNWDQRVQMIADALINVDPQLVALQEVRFNPQHPSTRGDYQNAAEQILAAIHDHRAGRSWSGTWIIYQPAMYYPVGGERWHYPRPDAPVQEWEGLAFLSRTRVLETGGRFLFPTNSNDPNQRNVRVMTTDGSLYLFNAHFSYDLANQNAQDTIAFMARYPGPRMLVGDLNSIPGSDAYNTLQNAGLIDLWPRFHTDAGHTVRNPWQRIDYCWVTSDLADSVQSIERFAMEPNSDRVYASDHVGLCVTLA